jgi:hypothetical protein
MEIRLSDEGPIFVVGTGRCGSTIVDSILAMHPQLSWMPSWVDTSGGYPVFAVVNRLWGRRFMDRYRESRFFPTPVEPYEVFERICQHFPREDVSEDVIAEAREKLVPVIDAIVRFHGNPRYLAKVVGRPVKVEMFATLFPNARFVHVTRGLKPTLSSLLKVHFFTGWGMIEDWKWDDIPADQIEFYRSRGESEVVGIAIRLRLNRVEIDRQLALVPPDLQIEVGYKDFVANPIEHLGRIADFAALSMESGFVERVRARNIYGGADDKWMTHFDEDQIRDLDEFETRFGY